MSEHNFYITRLKNLHKHPNADRLQIGECFGNSVIVSMDYTNDQLGVYFPVDLQLSEEFCDVNNLTRKKDENGKEIGGYLDPDKRNIKAIKLRGEKSDGLFLPLTCLSEFVTISELKDGQCYDALNGKQICCKYIPRTNYVYSKLKESASKKAKAKICPTFYEHVETEQIAYNLDKFNVGDTVELTLKMHGTSQRTGYLPISHTKRTLFDKIFKRHGKDYFEYGYITGTRRVVLDDTHDSGFYDDNSFRTAMSDKFTNKLKKGETIYYEVVGFQGPNGAPIMSSVENSKISDKEFTKMYGKQTVFSYGCDQSSGYTKERIGTCPDGTPIYSSVCCEVYVYRITMTNEDGDSVEYSPDQIRYRCEQMGVNAVIPFERFIIPEDPIWERDGAADHVSPGEYVVHKIEQYYDGPDPVGKTHVREGVVARILNRNNYAVYKHKNFSFKCLEGIAKDVAATPDIEEAQEV